MRCQLRYCHLSWGHKQHVQGLVGGQNLAYGMKGRGSNSQGRNNGKGSKVKYSRPTISSLGGRRHGRLVCYRYTTGALVHAMVLDLFV